MKTIQKIRVEEKFVETQEGVEIEIAENDKVLARYSMPAYMTDRKRYCVKVNSRGQRYLVTKHDREDTTYYIDCDTIDACLDEYNTL